MEQLIEVLQDEVKGLKKVVQEELTMRRRLQKSLEQARRDIDWLVRVVNRPKLQPVRTSTPIPGSSKVTPKPTHAQRVHKPQTFFPTQFSNHSALKSVKRAGRRSLNASYRRKSTGSRNTLIPVKTEVQTEMSCSIRRDRELEADEVNKQAKKPKLLQAGTEPQSVAETAPTVPVEPDNEEDRILETASQADTGSTLKDVLDILRSTALENMNIWNPAREIIKEHKESLINEMCSTEHIYHFTEKNAKSTARNLSPWYEIVRKAFPPMTEDDIHVLVKYLTLTARGNSFFAQLVKLLVKKHQRHCNSCQTSS